MFRCLLTMAILALWTPIATSDERPARHIDGWGDVVDPDGDCDFHANLGTLTLSVPGTSHDLCAETMALNAPRVLRTFEGDFIVQVKISGNVQHAGERTSGRSLAYHGAGLLLWLDEQTYVRLERAAIVQMDGEPLHYASFEIRRNGQMDDDGSRSMRLPNRDMYLRLERRGGQVYGSVSDDEKQWIAFQPFAVDLPRKTRLGVAAISTSSEPFKAAFSDLQLYRRENPATRP